MKLDYHMMGYWVRMGSGVSPVRMTQGISRRLLTPHNIGKTYCVFCAQSSCAQLSHAKLSVHSHHMSRLERILWSDAKKVFVRNFCRFAQWWNFHHERWLQICRNYNLQSGWTLKSSRIENFMQNSSLKRFNIVYTYY